MPGTLLKHYKHDGLGRLVETQSPYPDPQTSLGDVRTERFFYDGVRRIQEMIIDPVMILSAASESGDPELEAIAANAAPEGEPEADPDSATLELVEEQIPTLITSLAREYIWGPGDRGVDELLVQYDAARAPWWMLVDGSGDVVAMSKKIGSGSSAYAQVSAQWTYDAYGAVIDQDVFDANAPINRCGHKGLFADRLDVGVLDYNGQEEHRLEVAADTLYYNRNRTFAPYQGRFLQSDPNATGLVSQGATPYHGNSGGHSSPRFSMFDLSGDGASLYCYVAANPWNRSDALGLYSAGEWWQDTKEVGAFVLNGL